MTFPFADFDSDIMLLNRENAKYPRMGGKSQNQTRHRSHSVPT